MSDEKLFNAIACGRYEEVKLLLEQKVDLNIVDKNGCTPGGRAPSGCTPLMYAAMYNYKPDISALLIKYRANINQVDYDKKTALYHAVENMKHKIVELLLGYKATDYRGNRACINDFGGYEWY